MFDDYEYGDILTVTLSDGSSVTGEFCGVDDAEDTNSGLEEVDLFDGRFSRTVRTDDIVSIDRSIIGVRMPWQ